MRILVVPRYWIKNKLEADSDFYMNGNFISIYSTGKFGEVYSPLPDRWNILKLQFDDITDGVDQQNEIKRYKLILFNENHAESIKKFISEINQKELLYIHCDAGISRSGAVGDVLNEYFNKYLADNQDDYTWFKTHNKQIMPNPLVKRILTNILFDKDDYSKIF